MPPSPRFRFLAALVPASILWYNSSRRRSGDFFPWEVLLMKLCIDWAPRKV